MGVGICSVYGGGVRGPVPAGDTLVSPLTAIAYEKPRAVKPSRNSVTSLYPWPPARPARGRCSGSSTSIASSAISHFFRNASPRGAPALAPGRRHPSAAQLSGRYNRQAERSATVPRESGCSGARLLTSNEPSSTVPSAFALGPFNRGTTPPCYTAHRTGARASLRE